MSLPLSDVIVAYAPGAVDAMMILALALHLDPVFVGAHHLTRVFVVSLGLPILAHVYAAARRQRQSPDGAGGETSEDWIMRGMMLQSSWGGPKAYSLRPA